MSEYVHVDHRRSPEFQYVAVASDDGHEVPLALLLPTIVQFFTNLTVLSVTEDVQPQPGQD